MPGTEHLAGLLSYDPLLERPGFRASSNEVKDFYNKHPPVVDPEALQDLEGDVPLDREMFSAWVDLGPGRGSDSSVQGPLDRSPKALLVGTITDGPEILIMSDMIRGGKGLKTTS